MALTRRQLHRIRVFLGLETTRVYNDSQGKVRCARVLHTSNVSWAAQYILVLVSTMMFSQRGGRDLRSSGVYAGSLGATETGALRIMSSSFRIGTTSVSWDLDTPDGCKEISPLLKNYSMWKLTSTLPTIAISPA